MSKIPIFFTHMASFDADDHERFRPEKRRYDRMSYKCEVGG